MREPSDERHLLTRIAAKDQAALRTLMGLHQVKIYRFLVRRLRNEALAEEIVNDVFAEVWSHAGRFEGRSSVATWLLSIAHFRAVSRLRKRTEDAWDEDSAAEIADGDDDPEVVAQKADKGTVIRRCIDALSPAHREIIDLVYYHDQSVTEVGAILGIPEGTVKTRMFYARKQLADALKAAGVDRGWP